MSNPSLSDSGLWRRFKQGAPPAAECPDFNALAAYMDGRLNASELDRVERHIAACEHCREVMLASRAGSPASGAAPRRVTGRSAFAWASLAAACVLVCLAGFAMGQGTARTRHTETLVASDFSPLSAANHAVGD